MKILIISCTIIAITLITFKSTAGEKRFSIKPIVPEKWMNRAYLFKNFKYCKGKFYRKHIKCEWVK